MPGVSPAPTNRAAAADLPVLTFATAEEWSAWLAEHHETADGAWLAIAKKGSSHRTLSQPEAVEEALCHGWIDGQAKGLDDERWLQRFTPRRSRSKWSRINRERATALIEAGRMQPAGLREVQRAQADGRWDAAYEPPSSATVPDDLRRALDADERAAASFAALDAQNRYAILHRIQDAKRPETRARRIAKYVAMLAEGDKPYP
jgi:uncharacterized protein YdeI (YjbR/CyaY-like superfamily)